MNQQTGDVTFTESIITNSSNKPQEIQELVLEAAEGITTTDDVIWIVKIGNIKVYEGCIEKGKVQFEPFIIEAGLSAKMAIEVKGMSVALAKSLIGKDVAVANTQYNEKILTLYYTGTVQCPNYNGSADVGLAGASVTFIPTIGATSTTTTKEDGTYELNIVVGTAGTIEVTKAASGAEGDNGYSTDTFIVDTQKQEQATVHIGKIRSLAVILYDLKYGKQGGDGFYDKRETFWCPSFGDGSIALTDIKFLDKNKKIIEKRKEEIITSYQMADLYNSAGLTVSDKMIAQYFAICKAGNTLKCYQTVDEMWNNTFGDKNGNVISTEEGGIAESILSSFWTVNVFGKNLHRVQSAANPDKTTWSSTDTVYFDKSLDSIKWKDINKSYKEVEPPTLNGIIYSQDKRKSQPKINGWSETYGGQDGGVLSCWSKCPWSLDALNDRAVWVWESNYGYWYLYNRTTINPVVLSQAFNS